MSLPGEEQPAPAAVELQRRSGLSWLAAALVVVAAILLILELIPANYYMLLPGQALPVEPMIAIKGHPAARVKGRLFMTDVTLYRVHHLLEELYGRFDPNADLEPANDVSQGLSDQQYLKLNVQLMQDSIQQAEAAALQTTRHYKPRLAADSPRIVFVMPKTPAARLLKAEDVVLAVNGHPTNRRAANVAPYVHRLHPGQVAQLTIRRKGRVLHIAVKTIASANGAPSQVGKTALIGIYVQDHIIFPLKISINAGDIGGPSAGFMFSLGIVQRLANRDLTHGCTVAGTGTIDSAGNVGAIGGAKQKIIAAGRAGAKYFFVPTDREDVQGAKAGRGSVTVVPVKTLNQALTYLAHLRPCR